MRLWDSVGPTPHPCDFGSANCRNRDPTEVYRIEIIPAFLQGHIRIERNRSLQKDSAGSRQPSRHQVYENSFRSPEFQKHMYWEQHFSALGMAFFYEDLREHLYVNTGVFDVEISNVIFDLPEEIPNLLIYDVYLVRYRSE